MATHEWFEGGGCGGKVAEQKCELLKVIQKGDVQENF